MKTEILETTLNKELYVCEVCGLKSDNIGEVAACEREHKTEVCEHKWLADTYNTWEDRICARYCPECAKSDQITNAVLSDDLRIALTNLLFCLFDNKSNITEELLIKKFKEIKETEK